MKKIDTNDGWEQVARKALMGRKVVDVYYLPIKECEDMDWDRRPIVIVFDNGTAIYPSADDEGNGPGALFTNLRGAEIFPVLR